MQEEKISYLVAFSWGVLTFLSPCILPLIPSFIAFITGASIADLKDAGKARTARTGVIVHSLLFILGFSVVFVLLGLTATAIGKSLFKYQNIIRIAGGTLIAFFGLYLMGIIKLDFLAREWRLGIKAKGATYIGSFLIGVTFAAAWTPCVGSILGSILLLAATKDTVWEGAKLLSVYSLGIAVPFFLTALAVDKFLHYLNRFKRALGIINIVGGIFLVVVGVLVATNSLSSIWERMVGLFVR